jgi:hypothetical protein
MVTSGQIKTRLRVSCSDRYINGFRLNYFMVPHADRLVEGRLAFIIEGLELCLFLN